MTLQSLADLSEPFNAPEDELDDSSDLIEDDTDDTI
jgi:hypothetical protein